MMNKLVKTMPLVGLVACCAGCIANHVAWVEGSEPEITKRLNANYRFEGTDGAVEAANTLNGIDGQAGEQLDVTVSFAKGKAESTLGAAAMINNFFSVCTLGIWPFISSQEQKCTISLSGYDVSQQKDFVLGHRAWASFILPICALPCPGWGDWRSAASVSMEYDFGPGQKKWESDVVAGYVCEMLTDQLRKSIAESKAQNHAAAVEGVKKLRAALEAMKVN